MQRQYVGAAHSYNDDNVDGDEDDGDDDDYIASPAGAGLLHHSPPCTRTVSFSVCGGCWFIFLSVGTSFAQSMTLYKEGGEVR